MEFTNEDLEDMYKKLKGYDGILYYLIGCLNDMETKEGEPVLSDTDRKKLEGMF